MILSQIENLQKKLEERVLVTPKPGMKDENFRFVSLRDIELSDKDQSQRVPVEFNPSSDPAVTISPIEQPNRQIAGQFTQDFLMPKSLELDLFAIAAYARSQGGFFLHVKAGALVQHLVKTVHRHQTSTKITSPKTVYERSVVICEPGSELTWIDEFQGAEDTQLFGICRIRVCEGAKLNWVSVQNLATTAKRFHRVSLEIEKGAEVKWTSLQLGGKKGQLRIETELTGKNAALDAQTLVSGNGTQEFDFLINTHHFAGDTKSVYEHNTVVADKAHVVFNGNIVIPKDSVRSDARQKNKNMMLSKEASVDSFPKLEIATDEVSCAHGASISPVNWEQVFYLQSRGIPEAEARSLIIEGFAEPTLARIEDETLRERLRDMTAAKNGIQKGGDHEPV